MLAEISSNVSEMKSEFNGKLDTMKTEAKDQMHLLRSIKERLVFVEHRVDQRDNSPGNLLNHPSDREERLLSEIRQLKQEMVRLQRDNESLKNFRVAPFRGNPRSVVKINEFEIRSHSEHSSFSPISSPEAKKQGEDSYSKQIREFRLDSEMSQSIRPAKALFEDPLVQRVAEADNYSVRTSKGGGKNAVKAGAPAWNLMNPMRFLNRNLSSVLGDSRDSISNDNAEHFFEEDNRINKQVLRNQNEGQREKLSNDDSEKQRKISLKNVKNFDDFQNILKDLKMTLNASTYASFNENIDDNIRILEETLQKYSLVDDKIQQLYSQTTASSFSFEKRGSVNYEDQGAKFLEKLQVSEGKRSNSMLIHTNPNFILKQLNDLRTQSNLKYYESRIKEIKVNPSEFESFLYKIKQEVLKRESEFATIEQKLLINN